MIRGFNLNSNITSGFSSPSGIYLLKSRSSLKVNIKSKIFFWNIWNIPILNCEKAVLTFQLIKYSFFHLGSGEGLEKWNVSCCSYTEIFVQNSATNDVNLVDTKFRVLRRKHSTRVPKIRNLHTLHWSKLQNDQV